MEFWESFVVWLHVLLFVYWLGGDLGVFYTSKFRRDPETDPQSRLLISRIAADIDMAPRTTLVLMIPSGFTLAAIKGYVSINDAGLAGLWIFGFVWLALVWWLHIEKDAAKKAPWAKFDLGLRWALTLLLTLLAIISLATRQPIGQNFVALKLLMFAGTMLGGIMIRVTLARHRAAAQDDISQHGATPEREAVMRASPTGALKWVYMIWGLVALAAFVGIWKPYF